MIGFFEQAPGVRSMTRLTLAWLMVLASAVVGAFCFYIVHTKTPDAAVIGGIATVLGALVLKGVVAIKNRTPVDKQS